MKASSQTIDSFSHSHDSDTHNLVTRIDAGYDFRRYPAALVAHLYTDLFGVCFYLYFGCEGTRVPMDISQALLHDSKNCCFNLGVKSSQVLRNIQLYMYSAALGKAFCKVCQC